MTVPVWMLSVLRALETERVLLDHDYEIDIPCALLQVFRATNGKALVWGKPPKIISAKYITGDGKQKTSLLLASGDASLNMLWWGT